MSYSTFQVSNQNVWTLMKSLVELPNVGMDGYSIFEVV
jgi:hypothetical protein